MNKIELAGYIAVRYFRFEHFLLDHFVYFFKAKFLSSQLQSVFDRDMLNKYLYHVFELKKYIFFPHNRAALSQRLYHQP